MPKESSGKHNKARQGADPPKQALFKALMLAIPVAFFVLLEVGLRVTGYGVSSPLFLELEEDARYLYPNQELAERYFRNQTSLPTIPYHTFRKDRDNIDIRVVIQGGSSAAGYPFYHSGGLADYLEQFLDRGANSRISRESGVDPDRKSIEVINTALSAVNSFTLLDLSDEIIAVSPDLVVIYAGHNEYYGALGVASTESTFSSPGLVRMYLRVRGFRTVQLLQNTIAGILSLGGGSSPDAAKSGTLMGRMVGKADVPFGSDLHNQGLTQFRSNLTHLLAKYRKAGIPVLVSTIVSNEGDFEPFDGRHGDAAMDGKLDIALDTTVNAAAGSASSPSDSTASSLFATATRLLSSGEVDRARTLFQEARDRDRLRFRAPSAINAIIREVATADELVDSEVALRDYSENGIIGSSLITEHLHPTPLGYRLISHSIFSALIERDVLGKQLVNVEASAPDAPIATDSLAGTYRLLQIMNAWPFLPGDSPRWTDTLMARSEVEEIAIDHFRGKIGRLAAINSLQAHYQSTRELDKAVAAIDGAARQQRHLPDLPFTAGMILSNSGRFADARPYFEKSLAIDQSADGLRMIGSVSLQLGENERALRELTEALKYVPRNEQILFNLALVHARLRDYPAALGVIDNLLAVNPEHRDGNLLRRQIQNASQK